MIAIATAVEHQRLEILLLAAQFTLGAHQLVVFLFHLSISALQTVVEPRVLHDSEDLPQQHQADQHRSPDIDPGRQAAAPTGGAPSIGEDADRRYENVRQHEVHRRCSGRGDAVLDVSLCSPGDIVASSPGASRAAKAPKAYKHVPQRPAYIGERTRSIGVVQRPVGEVTVCNHYKG